MKQQICDYITVAFILIGVILLINSWLEKPDINSEIDNVGLFGEPDFRY